MVIKICGLTDIREVKYLKENKVDLAGMVLFFEKSKRNITDEKAREIIAEVKNQCGDTCKSVAVTVSPTADQIKAIVEAGFDYLQIHGTVRDEDISGCAIPILKAFNVDDLEVYEHYLSINEIAGFVFDAGEPGSGKTFDWDMLKGMKRDDKRMYILAGGLKPSNVEKAIQAVGPDGVDVSSGVEFEDRPGKDPEKIRSFVNAVRKVR